MYYTPRNRSSRIVTRCRWYVHSVFKEVIMLFSHEMQGFIMECYFETRSYKTIGEYFKEKFGNEQTLPNATLKRIIKRFKVNFHLEDAPHSGKPKGKKCVKKSLPRLAFWNINSLSVFLLPAVRDCIAFLCLAGRIAMHACQIGPTDTADPRLGSPHQGCVGTRRGALRQATFLPPFLLCTRVYSVLKDLNLDHVQTRQELKLIELEKRVGFCDWFLEFTHHRTSVLDNVFFTDEAWVHKSGYINSQNNHIWFN